MPQPISAIITYNGRIQTWMNVSCSPGTCSDTPTTVPDSLFCEAATMNTHIMAHLCLVLASQRTCKTMLGNILEAHVRCTGSTAQRSRRSQQPSAWPYQPPAAGDTCQSPHSLKTARQEDSIKLWIVALSIGPQSMSRSGHTCVGFT